MRWFWHLYLCWVPEPELIRELGASTHYETLCDRLAYSCDPDAAFPYRDMPHPPV